MVLAVTLFAVGASAQRRTDHLDRGLVAVQTAQGVYCSWRIMGEEYYDVAYNLYRDGVKVNEEPLLVSNFTDKEGTSTSQYTVKAVVRGTEQQVASQPAKVWAQKYLEVKMDHGKLKSTYIPNDACCADVDGDGELEILLKFDNLSWAENSYPKAGYQGEYCIIEVYKLNGTKLWWIDLGPNMADFQNNEQNIVAYDWDGDGRAEAVMRAADGTVIHQADGTEYVIGSKSKNYLGATNTGQWFVHEGDEFLVYMDGESGKPYQVMEYPLKRLEAGETNLEAAWGDGYGHRSTKHFFGAPVLDGRRASIFLARGIYTRHKMIALDVDPTTHKLTERWRWNSGSGMWYGQGYHNYAIADVDWDGRDEICFGSMVIDDNGRGLSSTGLGHGDAQHHGDFNPYIHGHEIFACNEDNPSNNYRDATTSKIYYRQAGGSDDGRCMAGNFSNAYPGAMAFSAHDEPISCVTNGHINGLAKSGVTDNFRIYWDGDLCEETQNYSNGKNTAIGIYKYGKGLIETLSGSMTNNDTKGTPCYQGDIFGDWREEVIARTAQNNIRIYFSATPTEWRNYTLWHDLQYRPAMVWQMCGYNQPPHVSYFLGELEGITAAPPALTMTNREEIANGSTITAADGNDKQLLLAETGDMSVSVAEGAAPYILFDNAPSWVQGHDNNDRITYQYYTHTLTGAAFTGDMRLVKQGDGTLVLPAVEQQYAGPTELWAGTLSFDGTMSKSHVWMNRFACLNSDGGRFLNGIDMSYASVLRPGGQDKAGRVETSELRLGFGARIQFDLFADGTADCVKAGKTSIEKKDWRNGPEYSTPVFELVAHPASDSSILPAGRYLIMELGTVDGSVDNIVVEGLSSQKKALVVEDGKLYVEVSELRDPAEVVWDGGDSGTWDLDNNLCFKTQAGDLCTFVSGDDVVFNDKARQSVIFVYDNLTPGSVTFDGSKNFTLRGTGSILGSGSLTMKGTGNLKIDITNQFTGGVNLMGGKTTVSALANADGVAYGALGGTDNKINFDGGTLTVTKTLVGSQPFTVGAGGGTIDVPSGMTLTLNGAGSGSKHRLTKSGGGTITLGGAQRYGALYVNGGTVNGSESSGSTHQYPDSVVLNAGTLKDPDNIYSYSSNSTTVVVPEGKTATWQLDGRCDYKGKLVGKGNLTVNVTSVRSSMQGDWSQFEGIINFQKVKTGSYDPSIQWNNTKGMGKATVTGVFDNNGKAVSIGTLSGNCTLTGDGRYTVKDISATVTRQRSSSTNTRITVANGLTLTGTVHVTLKGTYIYAGDEITLWTAGSFTGTNVKFDLPELPEGLEWDTSNLLKKTGVLRVVEATGIANVNLGDSLDLNVWYNLQGRRIQPPTQPGIYIHNGKKVVVK